MKLLSQTLTSVAVAMTAAISLSAGVEAATFGSNSSRSVPFFLDIPTSKLATVGGNIDNSNLSNSTTPSQLAIGLNFTASTLFDSGFIPPDTMGAVGSDRIVELINGKYSVYDKGTGALLQASSLNQFWSDAGVTPSGFLAFDPRVVYDPFSQRWYAVSADNPFGENNFLFAVSKSSDPITGWTGFAIDSDSTNQRWVDYPTLGFDRDGVYLAANMFPISASDLRTTIVALPKNDLLAATPTVANATKFENISVGETGFTLQPVVNLDNTGLPAALLSSFNTFAGEFKRSNIVGDITSPTLDTSNGLISVQPFFSRFSAEQPGAKQNIEIANGSIFHSNIILQNGAFWGGQTVDNGGRAALRWFQIDATTNQRLQEGLIADPNLDFYYGSLAVNDFGDVVIGFNGSGESQFVSSYAVLGQTVGGVTTFGNPLLLQAGAADYQVGTGRNRWGDYSATVLDPTDPFTFWTFQEFVFAENVWGTQITQLRVVPNTPNATIINGGFETGNFTGWTTTGNTSIQTSAFGSGPTEGTFQALLSTGGFTVSDSALETFLGLAPGSLDNLSNGNATAGSAIRQTFAAKAGDILTFDWNFLTDEFTPTFFNDFSFVSISFLEELADTTFPTFISSLTPFNEETGLQKFSFKIPTTGTYTLGLGVIDVADSIVDSGLLVDNVKLVSVPEPTSAFGFLAFGAFGVGSLLKRKQQQKV
ncbi:PEP-CTERM sorting domain-containing protein [Microseira wollei]|uniref:Peptidase domain protein n=1 Tax=Microseira wollei NIES-4236 TaxID=2530354 RepID=A0AAV3X463_9CYAN|nr:PEP-CTERM sorting domain-containing protein [Microseira wollei]GET37592.1 peptidase domain protein [Microseira wollei NIES-4236]